jgi:hypothetical protein
MRIPAAIQSIEWTQADMLGSIVLLKAFSGQGHLTEHLEVVPPSVWIKSRIDISGVTRTGQLPTNTAAISQAAER